MNKENKEKVEKIEPKIEKTEKRIGTITFGILLIVVGLSTIASLVLKFEIMRYVLTLWPLVLVSLGIEMIVISNKKDIKVKYDVFGCFMVAMILGTTFVTSMVSYAVNEVVFKTDFVKIVKEEIQNRENYHRELQEEQIKLQKENLELPEGHVVAE